MKLRKFGKPRRGVLVVLDFFFSKSDRELCERDVCSNLHCLLVFSVYELKYLRVNIPF